jgi:multiple sugar transport system permease protein
VSTLTVTRGGRRLALYAALGGGAFLMVAPFLYMVATALTEYAYTLPYPPRLIPSEPTWQNFVLAWTANNFSRFTLNSAMVAGTTVAAIVLVSSMMAYAFARIDFPAREYVFRLMIVTMMLPSMLALIPTFLVMRDFNLLNSRLGLVIIYTSTALAFNTFLLRSFFRGIPNELEDAVRVDGGGHWHIYRHVVMPLSKPALATVAIFSFLGAWDEYLLALVLITDPAKRTLPIAIAQFHGMHATNYSLVFAASIIALIPGLLLFAFFQRYFIQGLTLGATKY